MSDREPAASAAAPPPRVPTEPPVPGASPVPGGTPRSWLRRAAAEVRSLLLGLAVAALVLMAVGSLRGGLELPTQAPELRGEDVHGQPVALSALRGRPVVLYFWATWCTACSLTSPTVGQYARAHPDVAVLGVALDDEDDAWRALVTADKGFRIVRPAADLTRLWPVRALPSTVVIAADGQVVWSRQGVLLPGELNWRVPGVPH